MTETQLRRLIKESIEKYLHRGSNESLVDKDLHIHTENKRWGKVFLYNGDGYKFALYEYNDDPSTIYLSNVHVSENCRKNGLGNKILKIAEQQAKVYNKSFICLKCLKGSWVYSWYKRNGYTDFSVDKDLRYIWLKKQIR